ncbi:MAG: DUF2946 family protein [Bradyrhizobium sp.]
MRDHIRHGSWLALIALAVNIGLSFGHVHAFNGKPSPQGSQLVLIASPDGHHTPGHSDDKADYLCPICMAATAMANALASTPPLLQVAFADTPIDRAIEPAFVLVDQPRAPFQSRGPPTSPIAA